MLPRASRFAVVSALFLLVFPAALRAQPVEVRPAPAPAEEPPPVLTPPRLVEFAEATYPDEAREAGIEGAVELELTIGADGSVTEATVVSPLGHGLDEAAIEAARRFRFEPAKRNEVPIPSVIRYRYVFELKAEPELEEEVEPEVGRVEGTVLAAEDDRAIGGAWVELFDPAGNRVAASATSGAGTFVLADVPAGTYRLVLRHPERLEQSSVEVIGANELVEGTFRMRKAVEEADEAVFRAVAIVDPPPREVVRRTIRREELTRIPGTRGDALRTVELLPGVGRPPFGAGQLIVRGAAPRDSQVFFDGMPVPLLYHFGGLTSFVNSRLLDRIDFYPGNFSARYGRKVGGILDVGSRDPNFERWGGVLDINLLDASFLVEGPVSDKVSVAVAARRSYIDFFFDKLVPDDAFDLVAAPVYFDYQTIIAWKPNSKDRVRFLVYGSSDLFRIVLSDPAEGDPSVRGNLDLKTQFHYGQVSWLRTISPKVEQEFTLQTGPGFSEFGLGEDLRFDGKFLQTYGRAEWRGRFNDHVRLLGGLDLYFAPFKVDFRGPPPQQDEGNPSIMNPLSSAETIEISTTGSVVQPAGYLELELTPSQRFRFVLGNRLDWYSQIEKFSVNPRAVAVYSLDERTRLKWGAGLFSQPPEVAESYPGLGNTKLDPLHSIHLGTGVERDVVDGVRVGAEGFYKYIWNRVIGTEGGVPPRFTNEGFGRIYGLELSGRVSPIGRRWFGFLSYTLSRSERRDGPNENWRLFDFDQTHILTTAAVYRFPKNWEIGATIRLVSGNPQTPVVGSIYNARSDVYLPIYGNVNSLRNPLFHRLDIRVEKLWVFDYMRFAFYLDVQNFYNASNPEGRFYNFDFSRSARVNGLPLLPSIGIRGEL